MIHTIATLRYHPTHRRIEELHGQAAFANNNAVTICCIATNSIRKYAINSDRSRRSRGCGNIRQQAPRCSNNPTVEEAPISSNHFQSEASDVVRSFYDGINRRDLASVEYLIAVDCIYEDLVFPQPFVGRKAILGFFKQFTDSISADLQFAIDDISGEDSSAVGVTWHLEWKGKPFPFSKGCSFYRLGVIDGKRQITYGRDCVEPAIKPGETALAAIRGVTWLLQSFPSLADRL